MLKTVDPTQYVIVVGGVPITGFSQDSMATLEYDEDAYAKVTGIDLTTRVKKSNKSGMLTLSLQQSSPSNDVLSGFYLLDQASNSGAVPVLVKDNSGTTLAFSPAGWVRKMPAVELSTEVTDREWILDLSDLDMFVGGNS